MPNYVTPVAQTLLDQHTESANKLIDDRSAAFQRPFDDSTVRTSLDQHTESISQSIDDRLAAFQHSIQDFIRGSIRDSVKGMRLFDDCGTVAFNVPSKHAGLFDSLFSDHGCDLGFDDLDAFFSGGCAPALTVDLETTSYNGRCGHCCGVDGTSGSDWANRLSGGATKLLPDKGPHPL